MFGASIALAVPAKAPSPIEHRTPVASITRHVPRSGDLPAGVEIVFRHGNIDWLPELASQAGWPQDTWGRLGRIILRESGGCPYRRGGDIVDKNCNITGVSTWTHRSDSGLGQINGTHWKPDHPHYSGTICKRMGICTQEPLLDALTNLRAMKLLYDLAGWGPWDPCQWGPKFAKQCKASNP